MLTPEQARIHTFKVVPSLPEPLKPLLEIAYNLWWSWHPEAIDLYMRVDRQLWTEVNHNPIRLLGTCSQQRLDEVAKDEAFLACLHRVYERLQEHLNRTAWYQRHYPDTKDCCIAYYSAEFGLHRMPADLLRRPRRAGRRSPQVRLSELGLPLVGVGLLYGNGYFQQYLNADGWQQEFYPDLDFSRTLPIKPVATE
jgi:starch phosphorylase